MSIKKSLAVASGNYREALIERLRKDPDRAVALLNVMVTDECPEIFLDTLHTIIDVHGGTGEVSCGAEMTKKKLNSILSGKEDLNVSSLNKIMYALGMQLAVLPTRLQSRKVAKKATSAATKPKKRTVTKRMPLIPTHKDPKPNEALLLKKKPA